MAGEQRVIAHALFQFVDPETKLRRTAYRGDTVVVGEPELSFGEKHGAFMVETTLAEIVDERNDELVEEIETNELAADLDVADEPLLVEPEQVERPARVASKSQWVAYAKAKGADPVWADDPNTTKDELVARFGG